MDVVYTGFSFQKPYSFVVTQFPDYLAYVASQLSVDYLSPKLRYPDYVIFAFPNCV